MRDEVLTTIDNQYVLLSSISAVSNVHFHVLGKKWYFIHLKSGDKIEVSSSNENIHRIDEDRNTVVEKFTQYINTNQ